MRAVDDRNILDEFCLDFCAVVEQFTEYIVVSGFVAISSGRARSTEDIDIIIAPLTDTSFEALHAALIAAGFECMQSKRTKEIFSYLSQQLSVRYTREGEFLPEMEVKFAKDALDQYQLQTKVQLPLTGLAIWFSNINVNIAFKEHLLRSPKDMEDASHLRIVFQELIDEKEIKHVSALIDRYRLNG